MTRFIENIVLVALILGFIFLSIMITRVIYKPTEAEIDYVVKSAEKARHDRLMRKHGVQNTWYVERDADGSEWYFNQQGKRCQFK